ncbi:MAG: PAS domain S-box protein [Desulfobacterota bacterium]|jgi:PAS domain S-box-containing protein|nr:PAS domain S-box protein [Thermodesulfobacteriota bacterium]
MNLDALFNNLLTSGIGLSSSETLRKLRILNTFHLTVIMTAPILGLFYFYAGALVLFYVTIFTGLLMVVSLLLLRKTRNLNLGGHSAIAILWAFLFLVSWNTGAITFEGVIHPTWILNASLILLAVLIMGYLHGSLWTMAMFLQVGMIVYLYQIRFQFPNLLPMEMTSLYHLGTFMVGFLVLVLFAFLFEREREDALLREESKAQALRESVKSIDDILERSPVATFMIDRNHRVVQWNPACQALTGVGAGEILGRGTWEGFKMGPQGSLADMLLSDPGAVGDHLREAILSKSENGWVEMESLLPYFEKGRRALIGAGVLLDETGAVRGALQTVREVPGVSSDGALKDTGQVNEVFLSPVYKVDARGKISSWSRGCQEMFGYPAGEMIGRSASDIVAGRYRPLFEEALTRAFQGETSGTKTWRCQHKEGRPVYVSAKVFPLQAGNGGEKECAVVNANVTDLTLRLKRSENEAMETKEKLKNLIEEHGLLKKNIASFIRKKEEQ